MKRIRYLIEVLAVLLFPMYVSAQVRTSTQVISYIDKSESLI